MTLILDRPDLLRSAAFIDGAWIDGAECRIEVVNPADRTIVGSIPLHGSTETVRAVDAAERAMPGWIAAGATERARILKRWHALILDHAEDLARLMTAEQGKPLTEARGEIAYAASFVEWFAEEARRAYGSVIPGHQPDKRIIVLRQPVGIVAAITPWNFPAAMITRKLAPALAVGCAVVLKPSELTPLSAFALARLAEEAGFPAGILNIVAGDAPAIGDVLTSDPRIRKFSFTGSTPVGKMLAARCMTTVKRVSLELGGNAPFIIFDDADLDRAVEGAIISKFRNAGQTCVCANRLLVQAGIHDRFVERLAAKVHALRAGDGFAQENSQGPLINDAAVAKVERHLADALERGAQIVAQGAVQPDMSGSFFPATLLTGVPPESLLAHEETFGPLAGIIRFESEADAIRIANDTPAGLAAYLYTRDLARSTRVSEQLAYGMVGLNTGLISTTVAPFGGIKESGFGREGSFYALDDFLDTKLIVTEIPPA
jgi:succinate-semialdehyde dehydrogenase/glutarate-semialdehyde dehydrogenase